MNRFWSGGEPFAATFVNQRKQGSLYDADGNETWDDYGTSGRTHTYDAAGRKVRTSEQSQSAGGGGALAVAAGKDTASTSAAAGGGGVYPHMPEGGYYTTTTLTITQGYDGEGRSTKRVETKVQSTPWNQPVTTERVDYYVRSSVLGRRVITELNSGGQKKKTNVYAGSEVIAEQKLYSGGEQGLTWKQRNPMTGTEVESNGSGAVTNTNEYDPFRRELGKGDPYANEAEPDYASFGGGSFYSRGGNPFGGDSACQWNGAPVRCEMFDFIARSQQGVDWQGRTDGHIWREKWEDKFVPGTGEVTGFDENGQPIYDLGSVVATNVSYFQVVEGGGAPLATQVTMRQTQPLNSTPNPCEQKLAAIFGDPGAVMRTRYDVDGQYRGRNPEAAARFDRFDRGPLGNRFFDAEHLYNFPHLSGNQAGTENTQVYVPGGYERDSVTGPTRGEGIVTFYYKQWDVTLAAFHVGDFGLRPDGNRTRIGSTGGPGGDSGGARPNRHSHFELWNGRTGYLPPGSARDAARIPFVLAYCP